MMPRIDSLPPDAPPALAAIEQADLAVARMAGQMDDHPALDALSVASEMADQPPLIALSIGTTIAGIALRRPKLAEAGLRMLAAHLLATGMKAALKRSIDRTRPYVLTEEGRYVIEKGRRDDSRYNSFPSGHTAGAVAVAEAITRSYPRAAWPARMWAMAIAAIQIPRCAHYPSDLAVGAGIGVGADRIVRMVESAFLKAASR